MDAKETLERYAELRRTVDAAEKELDGLKSAVVEALEGGEGTYEGEGFKLSLRRTKKWEYTKVVTDLKAEYDTAKKAADATLADPKKALADAKKNEEKAGLATLLETVAAPMYKAV